jgi:transposase
MAAWLTATAGADPGRIAVAIEVPHGPVVENLLERGFRVHALNPKRMDRFRDRFTMAGAKDDSRDAEVMASALRTDPQCLRRLAVGEPLVIELREWSRIAEDLTVEHTRLTNQMREQLWRYFPAMLDLDADPGAPWLLDLWERVPDPTKAARLRKSSLAKLLQSHRIRRLDADEVLRLLRQPPLKVADGAVQAAQARIRTLVPRIRLTHQQIKQAHRRLDDLTAQLGAQPELPRGQPSLGSEPQAQPGQPRQRDAEILASLPGVGRIVLATLLAEAFEPLQRRDYAALRSLAGVAPVTKRSGKSCIVVRRQACHDRLANALYHWARVATQHDPTSRAKYAALRSRGHTHGRAIRSVGDRLLNVACSMLKAGTLFDPLKASAAAKTAC